MAPAPIEVKIVDRGGLAVAEPLAPVEPLDHETVRAVRDMVRTRRRAGDIEVFGP